LKELQHIARFYTVDYDDEELLWTRISGVEMPPSFNRKRVEILLDIPPSYPDMPPEWFHLDKELRVRGVPLEKLTTHYFPRGDYASYASKGWAAYCVHLENWRPKVRIWDGDNFATVIAAIKAILWRIHEKGAHHG